MKKSIIETLRSEYDLALQQGGTKAMFSKEPIRRILSELTGMDSFLSDLARIEALEDACAYVRYETDEAGEAPRAYVYAPAENSEYKRAAEGNNYREAIDAFLANVQDEPRPL